MKYGLVSFNSGYLTGLGLWDLVSSITQLAPTFSDIASRDNWARTTSPNKNVKVYIGAPASSTAAGSGYQSIGTLSSIAVQMRKSFPSFGGVMLWDASQAYGVSLFIFVIFVWSRLIITTERSQRSLRPSNQELSYGSWWNRIHFSCVLCAGLCHRNELPRGLKGLVWRVRPLNSHG